ncbi:hypothetical protein GCM10010301_35090 [Streptomyces plicatus]|nr:hypothetical protein GCM10010301_35090 [Streptomyces plicatus]
MLSTPPRKRAGSRSGIRAVVVAMMALPVPMARSHDGPLGGYPLRGLACTEAEILSEAVPLPPEQRDQVGGYGIGNSSTGRSQATAGGFARAVPVGRAPTAR